MIPITKITEFTFFLVFLENYKCNNYTQPSHVDGSY
jgi:hypothetical protein